MKYTEEIVRPRPQCAGYFPESVMVRLKNIDDLKRAFFCENCAQRITYRAMKPDLSRQ